MPDPARDAADLRGRIARALFAHDHQTYRYDGAFTGDLADAYMEAAAVVLDEIEDVRCSTESPRFTREHPLGTWEDAKRAEHAERWPKSSDPS